MVEIFTRLPVKSLLRFRSVSKSLCSCIDSRSFINLHTLRSQQKLLIFHRDVNKRGTDFEYFCTLHSEDQLSLSSYDGLIPVVAPLASYITIVGLCNGILCLSCSKKIVILWNPSIRRKLILPGCPNDPDIMGFGFDSITNDYKFVALYYKYKGIHSASIYSMKTGTWCEIASSPSILYHMGEIGCFLNGSLHWIVRRYKNDTDKGENSCCIMTLDLSTHVFVTTELPITTSSPIVDNLIILNGSLALVSTLDCTTWIWSRRGYNDTYSWHVDFKFEKVNHDGFAMCLPQLTANGELLLKCYYSGFKAYNPYTMVHSKLVEFNNYSEITSLTKYVESREWLGTGTACEVNWPSSRGAKEGIRKTLQKIRDCVSFLVYPLERHLKITCG